jgi:hypothetical protein
MELVYSQGCSGDYVSLDNQPIAEFAEAYGIEKLEKIFLKVLSKVKETNCITYQMIIDDALETAIMELGEYQDFGQCEQCGAWCDEYKYKID